MHPDDETVSRHATTEGAVVDVRGPDGRLQVWRGSELVPVARR